MARNRDKQIAYVQAALKADKIKNPNRPMNEFVELCDLIVSQFQDMHSFKIVRSGKGTDALDQKETKSINEVSVSVEIDGKSIWRNK